MFYEIITMICLCEFCDAKARKKQLLGTNAQGVGKWCFQELAIYEKNAAFSSG